MPYALPCSDGPWEMLRPRSPSLFIVRRLFTLDDNSDVQYRGEVAYPPIGTLVLYLPVERNEIEDRELWKVRLMAFGCGRSSEAEWVHPGILAAIEGAIQIQADDQSCAWPATFDRMSCHNMGSAYKPSWEERQHSGHCEACIRRIAEDSSFFRHVR